MLCGSKEPLTVITGAIRSLRNTLLSDETIDFTFDNRSCSDSNFTMEDDFIDVNEQRVGDSSPIFTLRTAQ